ncbi:hypothetical protein [Mycetocola saprophilus]|uniref:hypothetical protein n=1 Tax=Mycetocola saprophilus TaxID=76636 RepID=UPI0004C01CCD|nr:hypothetical protein [Mycetocola saprophilus]
MNSLLAFLVCYSAIMTVGLWGYIGPRHSRLGREWLEARADSRELRERLRWIEGELVSRSIEIDWPQERLLTAEDLNGWDHNHAPLP